MRFAKPQAGKTYAPGPNFVQVGDGLPRTVISLTVGASSDRFIVNFRTKEGVGTASDNAWNHWANEVGAHIVSDESVHALIRRMRETKHQADQEIALAPSPEARLMVLAKHAEIALGYLGKAAEELEGLVGEKA